MNESKHPIIKDLHQKLNNCKQQLLVLLDDWHTMQNVVQPQLYFAYDNIFGNLEFQIKQKSDQAERIHRRIDILSLKLKKGQKIDKSTVNYINMVVENEQQNKLNQNKFKQNNSSINNLSNQDDKSKLESKTQMFRTLAKKIHPDINGENDYFNKFWNNIQDAYKKGNVHRLRLFHQTLCSTTLSNNPSDSKEEEINLRREIRVLEANINEEKEKLNKLKSSEPFNLQEKLEDNNWVNQRKNILHKKLEVLDNRIKNNEKYLINISKLYGYEDKFLIDSIISN